MPRKKGTSPPPMVYVNMMISVIKGRRRNSDICLAILSLVFDGDSDNAFHPDFMSSEWLFFLSGHPDLQS